MWEVSSRSSSCQAKPRHFDISTVNLIGVEGAQALSELLVVNSTLTTLGLEGDKHTQVSLIRRNKPNIAQPTSWVMKEYVL